MSLQQRLERLSSVLTGLVAPRLAQSSHSSVGRLPTLSECRYHEPENLPKIIHLRAKGVRPLPQSWTLL
jgi:hypothetical protein